MKKLFSHFSTTLFICCLLLLGNNSNLQAQCEALQNEQIARTSYQNKIKLEWIPQEDVNYNVSFWKAGFFSSAAIVPVDTSDPTLFKTEIEGLDENSNYKIEVCSNCADGTSDCRITEVLTEPSVDIIIQLGGLLADLRILRDINNINTNLLGGKLGVAVNIPLFKNTNTYKINPLGRLSLQPELNYFRRGDESFINASGTVNLLLQYAEFPLLVKFELWKQKKFQLLQRAKFYVAPDILYLIDADSNIDPISRDDFKELDYLLGTGIEFDLLPNLWIDIRYNQGFQDIAESGNIPIEIYNSQVWVSLKLVIISP